MLNDTFHFKLWADDLASKLNTSRLILGAFDSKES
jgi:hypothetical protein